MFFQKFSVDDHAPTGESTSNFLCQEKTVPSPFAAKLVTRFAVRPGPVCWFYHGQDSMFLKQIQKSFL